MNEKKYIIRYKLPSRGSKCWWHFYRIQNGDVQSYATPLAKSIKKMTLKEAKKYIPKIIKSCKKEDNELAKIEIINTETNKIVNPYYKPEPEVEISRFELMEL